MTIKCYKSNNPFILTHIALFVILLYASLERWSSWFKAPVLKTGVGVTLPWVRIPVSPPYGEVPKLAEGDGLLNR
jgi:hypothetical protein